MAKPDNHAEIQEEWNSISDTFHLLMGAKQGGLPTPFEVTVGFDGSEAEARGSARHVTEQVEDEGYAVRLDYQGETESAVSGGERHMFDIAVTDAVQDDDEESPDSSV